MKEFRKLAVLGGGLLGGSLALAAGRFMEVALWARRQETVDRALEDGIGNATTDLALALGDADLVILTVPVGSMPAVIARALEAGLRTDALVSDVGSVKLAVHRELAPTLRAAGVRFIGGHPMAGSEEKGIGAARSELFEEAACLLTDDENVGEPWSSGLEAFWSRVGCRVSWIDAQRHDELVAKISHFPHLMAAATALVSLRVPGDSCFGGGGLRDTTRVAGGDAGMWAEILVENRQAVAGSVKLAMQRLGEMLAMLEAGDHEAVRAWLEQARELHAQARSRRQTW